MLLGSLVACGAPGAGPGAPLGPLRWDLEGATADVVGTLARAAGERAEGAVEGSGRFHSVAPIPPADALDAALATILRSDGGVERGPGLVRLTSAPAAWSVRVPAPLAGGDALAGARGTAGEAPWGFDTTAGGTLYAWCQCAEVPFAATVAPAGRLGAPAVSVLALDRPAALVRPPGSEDVRAVAVGGEVDGHRLVALDPEIRWEPEWEVPGTPDHPLRFSADQLAEVTDPARAATLARVIPHRGPDGAVDGVRLSAIRRGSLLDQLGFHNGDVIQRVADLPVATPEAAEAARRALLGAAAFCVELERRGAVQQLCFSRDGG